MISKSSNKRILKKHFAFNVWNINSAKAVIDAAVECNQTIFLQISSKVFDEIEIEEFTSVIKNYISRKNASVIIHLDHSKDIKQIERAINLNWDSVMFDGSNLPLEKNIEITNEVTKLAHNKNVMVEAELGIIKGEEDGISYENDVFVKIDDIQKFVSSTNIDLLAVAIGTSHGQYNGKEPSINYDLLGNITRLVSVPFVVHGGSELSNETLIKLLKYRNVSKINISTDIKQAYRMGLINASNQNLLNEKGFDPKKVERLIHDSIKKKAISKLKNLEVILDE